MLVNLVSHEEAAAVRVTVLQMPLAHHCQVLAVHLHTQLLRGEALRVHLHQEAAILTNFIPLVPRRTMDRCGERWVPRGHTRTLGNLLALLEGPDMDPPHRESNSCCWEQCARAWSGPATSQHAQLHCQGGPGAQSLGVGHAIRGRPGAAFIADPAPFAGQAPPMAEGVTQTNRLKLGCVPRA